MEFVPLSDLPISAILPPDRKTKGMAFILGVILFVVVVGWIDAGLPWPGPQKEDPR